MSKFKAGDRVCITPPEDWDTGPSFVKEMHRWCGSPVVIQAVVHEGEHYEGGGWYTLVGGESYYFAGDWMEKAVKFKGNK
jgi:hypothetical protein